MKELKTFDNPKNVQRLLKVFYASLVVLLISEFFIHKHAEFPWEEAHGFYAVYGFFSCVMLIFVAKVIRKIVIREEDYYEKDETDV